VWMTRGTPSNAWRQTPPDMGGRFLCYMRTVLVLRRTLQQRRPGTCMCAAAICATIPAIVERVPSGHVVLLHVPSRGRSIGARAGAALRLVGALTTGKQLLPSGHQRVSRASPGAVVHGSCTAGAQQRGDLERV
jgi:hypothetical protein